jgi:D-arabinose 1-dehydrogenase-like Zn-dependent alcohol dehydrogenase
VLRIGGLGHPAAQFAAKMGCQTVAIARGTDKELFARDLGARHYVDSVTQEVAAELNAMGGGRVVLATATNAQSVSKTIGGLSVNGKLVVTGASAEAILAWPSGTSKDSEETMAFSALSQIRPMIETMPLERAPEVYDRMMSGNSEWY